MVEEIKQQNPVRSLRISDDVMGKFKVIQDELHLTHDTALKMLIDGYELEMAKNAIPDRETEISNFQMKASELVEAFIHSLQLNQDAEARVRSSFELQLQTKDKTISGLYEKVEALKTENEAQRSEVAEAKEKLSETLKTLQNAEKEAQKAESSLSTSNALIEAKNAEIERLSSETVAIPTLKKTVEDLRAENTTHKTSILDLQRTVEDMKKEAERVAADHEKALQIAKKDAENEKKAAVLETKEFYISKIEKKDEEISALQKENATIASLKEEIERLKAENTNLKLAAEEKKEKEKKNPSFEQKKLEEETDLF